jgi:hypothetical protein
MRKILGCHSGKQLSEKTDEERGKVGSVGASTQASGFRQLKKKYD